MDRFNLGVAKPEGAVSETLQLKDKLYLVGGFNPSEKYQSVADFVPNIWKNKIHVPNHQPNILIITDLNNNPSQIPSEQPFHVC